MDGQLRDLVGEVMASNPSSRRKQIETIARAVYVVIILSLFLVSLHLYTRPDSVVLRVFGVIAALALTAVSVLWAFATHYSAAGWQRWSATGFWIADLLIGALNVITDFSHELKYPMPDWMYSWYTLGSILSIIFAAAGLAIYLRLSPEQKTNDAMASSVQLVGNAIAMAISNPDDATKSIINQGASEIVTAVTHASVASLREGLGKSVSGAAQSTRPTPLPIRPPMAPPESGSPPRPPMALPGVPQRVFGNAAPGGQAPNE